MPKRKKNLQDLDTEIMQKLYDKYIYFVVGIAKRYICSYKCLNLTIEDLIQEGFLGLLRAWELFDKTRGYKFITLGGRFVRMYILKTIKEKEPIIHIPNYLFKDAKKYRQFKQEFLAKFDREPTIKEIAERMESTLNRAEAAKRFSTGFPKIHSLYPPTEKEGKEGIEALGQTLIAKHVFKPNFTEIKNLLRKELTEREQIVVIYKFGLFGINSLSLEKIGDVLNLSRERVRQIFNEAMEKLKSSES